MAVASAGVLSFILRADDKASMPLMRLGASADRLALRMTRLGERVRGLGSLSRLSAGARSVTRSLEGIVPPLSVLTAAGTLAGITALATRFASFGAELGRTAYRVQASVSALHSLQGAARLSGSSAEAMTQTLEGLGDALLDATAGRDVNAAMYFNQLGISMRDAATGGARLATDVLPEVADQIARIKDPRIQANVMSALRIPAAALPFLRQGAAGLRDYQREAREYGVVTANGAEIARRFELAQARLSLATDGLGKAIGERLAPYIGGILESMAGWIRVNRDWVATKLDQGVRWLTEAVIGAYEAVKKWAGDGGWDRLQLSLTSIGRAAGAIFGADSDSMTGIERWVRRIDDVVKKVNDWQQSLERLQRNPLMRWWFDMDPERVAPPAVPGSAPGGAAAPGSNWQLPSRLVDDVLRQPWRDITRQGQPRGIRNNNPLNLTHVPGQVGLDPAQPSDGRFGRYATMEDGVAQSVRQMQIHFDRRGDDTLAKMITRWAPPGENDTAGYIARVSRETGLDPNAALNVRDFETLRRMVASMARMENGVPVDQETVDRGVRMGLGQPVAPRVAAPAVPAGAAPGAAGAAPPAAPSMMAPGTGGAPASPATAPAAVGAPQRVDVRVRLEGAGTQGATTTTRGPDGAVRVERSMQDGFGG